MTHATVALTAQMHGHTDTHTPKHMHYGAWLGEVYEVSAVSAAQHTCETISYSPASLPTQTLPFSVFFISRCAVVLF